MDNQQLFSRPLARFPVMFIPELSSLNEAYPEAFLMCHHSAWCDKEIEDESDYEIVHKDYLSREEFEELSKQKKECTKKHYFVKLVSTDCKVSYRFILLDNLMQKRKNQIHVPMDAFGFSHAVSELSKYEFLAIIFAPNAETNVPPFKIICKRPASDDPLDFLTISFSTREAMYGGNNFDFCMQNDIAHLLYRDARKLSSCPTQFISWIFGFYQMIICSGNQISVHTNYPLSSEETKLLLYRNTEEQPTFQTQN